MKNYHFSPSECHNYLYKTTKRTIEYKDDIKNILEWQKKLRKKLKEIMGDFPSKFSTKYPLNARVIEKEEFKEFYREKIIFTSEPYADVPCYLLIPKTLKTPLPTMICLQGHSSGMHISIGIAKSENDEKSIKGDRDIALQAVKNGFIAFAIEQRNFGEREEVKLLNRALDRCQDATSHALMLGRTVIGERVGDVMRSIDYLYTRKEVDKERIYSTGNSAGGTITFYSACLDKRIKGALVSCAFCTYKDSIFSIHHCFDNYLPGILKYAEMYDLAGLIAPRPLLIVAGKEDGIFPIDGVKKAFKVVKKIYKRFNAEEKTKLVVGDGGHRYYADLAWRDFSKLII